MKIENAKIKSTMLGIEDHGIFTAMIHLEGGGWGCGFGGYCFDEPKHDKSGAFICREGTPFGVEFIRRVMAVAEVDEWEKLPGKFVRCETGGMGQRIIKIGHITKDIWFDPAELAEKMNPKNGGK